SGLAAVAAEVRLRRIHRDHAGLSQSRRAADQLIETARAIAPPADTKLTPVTEAELLTAEAEYARITGGDAAARWDEAAAAWAELRYPFPQAYADGARPSWNSHRARALRPLLSSPRRGTRPHHWPLSSCGKRSKR